MIRLRKIRRQRPSGDRGQSLILVMMISVLLFTMLGTGLSVLTSQIRPSRASLDSALATAAAEAGLEDFVAQVNQNCPVVLNCNWLGTIGVTPYRSNPSTPVSTATTAGVPINGSDGTNANNAYYQWQIVYPDKSNAFVRVKSTGQIPRGPGGGGGFLTKTLIADLRGAPGFPEFQYYTTFETYSADYLNSLYKDRYINVTNAANWQDMQVTNNADQKAGLLHWTAQSAGGYTIPQQTRICEDLYWGPTANGPGRTSASYAATNPRYFPTSDFAWYTERGVFTPNSRPSLNLTHADTCDVAFEAGMEMNGPLYTQDAYLLDSFMSSTNRGDGCSNNTSQNPVFTANSTAGRHDNAFSLLPDTPSLTQPNTHQFRTYASYGDTSDNGGLPATFDSDSSGCREFPQQTGFSINLPDNINDVNKHAPCIYTGPTRIQFVDDVAYVTSPGTTAVAGSVCYSSDPSYVNSGASGGVVHARVRLYDTVAGKSFPRIFYAKNPSTGTPGTATAANRIFDLATTQTTPSASYSNGLTATGASTTWTGTYTPGTACPTTPTATSRRTFDCETGTPNGSGIYPDVFGNIYGAVSTALQAASPDAASIRTAIINQMTGATTAPSRVVAAVPSSVPNNTSLFKVDVSLVAGSPVAGAAVRPADFGTVDPFFQSTLGNGYTPKTNSWNVTITRYACPASGPAGGCPNNGSNKFTTDALLNNQTVSQTFNTANANQNSTAKFPWFGTSQTDPNNDMTQYRTGYGDIYVEGRVRGNVSVVADHDLYLTNAVNYYKTSPLVGAGATTDGAAYVSGHNTLLYRPLSCVSADPSPIPAGGHATTPGYCPDDLSGADDNPSPKFTGQYGPAQAYKNMAGPSFINNTQCGGYCDKNDTVSIFGTFFTLAVTDSTSTRTGGSFISDNMGRGDDNGNVNVTGGLYQYHRGATKMQWKNNPGGANVERPGLTMKFSYDNMRLGGTSNGSSRVPWLPVPTGTTGSRQWNVVSMATGS